MAPGATLQVSTWMRAVGTRAAPIVFRAQNQAAGRWGSIVFQGPVPASAGSNLEWCRIEGAGDSGVTIINNEFVTIRHCSLTQNSSPARGGALRVVLSSGTLSVESSDLLANTSLLSGGGLDADIGAGATLRVTGCRIGQNVVNPNRAPGRFTGGGVRATGAGTISMQGCAVYANRMATLTCGGQVATAGGGIYGDSGGFDIVGCSIRGNVCDSETVVSTCGSQSARATGGGIELGSNVQAAAIRNSLVSCNEVRVRGLGPLVAIGGGLYSASGNLTMVNATVARNTGGGVEVAAGSMSARNSIIYFNGGSQIAGAASIDYSCVEGGVSGGVGNIAFNPVFAGAGCAPEDFGLSVFSFCVDAGDPAPAFDDACQPPGRGSARNDMGAQGGPGACDFLPPVRILCAGESYGELVGGANTLFLDWVQVAGAPSYLGRVEASGAAPSSAGALLVGTRTGTARFGDVTVLLDTMQPIGELPIVFDSRGRFALPVPLDLQPLAGRHIAVQIVGLDPAGLRATNGLRLSPCY